MGVLDDAIREHLELKRRHGVGEDELRRQEEEALGPARREVAPAEQEETAAEVEQTEPEAEQAQAEPETEQPELSEAMPPEAVRSDVHDDDLPATDEHAAVSDTPPQGFEEVDYPEEPEEFDEPGDDDEVAELDDDELLEDDDGDPDDDGDVLEDTPEFLQETPEHDRLWFEQKPPRDFDFD
jgi:hypothetical protein